MRRAFACARRQSRRCGEKKLPSVHKQDYFIFGKLNLETDAAHQFQSIALLHNARPHE